MNENPAFIQALQNMGLTRTEAEVYLATLQTSVEEPVSGYKVAQVMGRDPANLSKTLAHLVKIGAVRLVQARPRHYVGVPVAEFTDMLMARMTESQEKAITLMASLGTSATSQQPTPLENVPHIVAQARRIISQSRGNVVLCCDDNTLAQLEEFLEDLGRNFPDLALVVSSSEKVISGIRMYVHNGRFLMNTGFAENIVENWILVAADSGQWLSAFFNATDTSINSRGWVGTNHEIALPIKTVIVSLIADSPIHQAPGFTLETCLPDADQQQSITDKINKVEESFQSGGLAMEANGPGPVAKEENPENIEQKSVPNETNKQAIPQETPLNENPSGEDGFKFLVQHEDEDEDDL